MLKAMLFFMLFAALLPAQNFDLRTLDGEKIHVQNLEGNLLFDRPAYRKGNLILFFFGTACPYCKKEIPQIKAYAEAGRVEVLAAEVQMPVSDRALQRFVEKEGLRFSVLDKASGEKLARYLLKRKVWIGGVPSYIWVDKYGNLESMDLEELSRFR